jgi:heme/copper-type cytochrome/quinol oxidase subunit 3
LSAAAEHHAPATTLGVSHYKLAMWTFLGSECFFFGSLIGTYMSYRGKSLNGPYPRDVFSANITSMSTFDLLLSSLFMALAVHYAKEKNLQQMLVWLGATILGGLVFLGFQAFEFTHFYEDGLTPRVNLFGATFFTLTGFHGAHVTVGVLLLSSLAVMAVKGKINNLGEATEIIGLYWHFVDIVWIAIFTLVYLMEYA